nr:hypothetical protein [Tanacetum cinerariifolium]
MTLFNGTCNNCIYGDEKPLTCNECGGILRGGFCLPCDLKAENSYNFYQDAYSFNDLSNNSNYLPQPLYENYLCNLCGNNSHDGYDCQQQFSFVYEQEPSYNQNYDDLKELAEYKESLENSSNKIDASSSNQEKEEPPQDSKIRKLIREECYVKVCEEQKQSMEDTMLELVKICQQKELLCIHDNVDNLIKSALNTKLLSINSNTQRLDKKEQEVKNVVDMGYEHSNTTPKTESDEIIKFGVEELVPILSENEVTLEDKREFCDDFEDIEYVKASLSDPEIVSIEEENVVHQAENVVQQEEEEVDLEDISQIQDVVLREKLLSIIRLISNIASLNDNPNSDRVLNSSVSIPIFEETDNFLSDNFSPEFETFCDHTEEMRSGNTTTHANDSLPEYDSFCFEIEPDQERLINVMKNDISDDSSNDPLLEEADLFLASDNSIPSGIENVADNSEGDIRFLEELLIDDSILSHESSDSYFEDNPSVPRPPPEPPYFKNDAGEEIPVVMNNKDKFDEDYYFFMFDKVFSFLSAESEDTIFDPGIFD